MSFGIMLRLHAIAAVVLLLSLSQSMDATPLVVDPLRLHSYFCIAASQTLCLGISSLNDTPIVDPARPFKLQVKLRDRNEAKGSDYLKMRWAVDRNRGTIRMSNFTSLCASKMLPTSTTPGDAVVKDCKTMTSLQIFDLSAFLTNANEQGRIKMMQFPNQCLTLMERNRIHTSTDDFCDPKSSREFTGTTFNPEAQRGSYVKFMPCRPGSKSQEWRQALDCAPNCSPYMLEGPNNVCDAECNNQQCNWDNLACGTSGPTPPTWNPTISPSFFPTTSSPTLRPSGVPSNSQPSSHPSKAPHSSMPSTNPTFPPSSSPRYSTPTLSPSLNPSDVPTTSRPSLSPTNIPSWSPTKSPGSSAINLSNGPLLAEAQPNLVWLWILITVLILMLLIITILLCRRRRTTEKQQLASNPALLQDRPAAMIPMWGRRTICGLQSPQSKGKSTFMRLQTKNLNKSDVANPRSLHEDKGGMPAFSLQIKIPEFELQNRMSSGRPTPFAVESPRSAKARDLTGSPGMAWNGLLPEEDAEAEASLQRIDVRRRSEQLSVAELHDALEARRAVVGPLETVFEIDVEKDRSRLAMSLV